MSPNIKRESSPESGKFGLFAISLEKHKARDSAKTKSKPKPETWSIQKRKRFFFRTSTKNLAKLMKKHYQNISMLFDPSVYVNKQDCYLHPCPPEKEDGTLPGGYYMSYGWRDDLNLLHKYKVNFGIIARVLKAGKPGEAGLSEEEMDGLINEAWHASHRCGNKTCMNWRHFSVEPGPVNSSRNRCLRSRFPRPCPHFPRCLRQYTRRLLLSQSIRRAIYYCIVTIDSFPTLDQDIIDIVDEVSNCNRFQMCSICKKPHSLAPFCAVLDSVKNCRALSSALRTVRKPTEQVKKIIGYLEDVKADLQLRNKLRFRR